MQSPATIRPCGKLCHLSGKPHLVSILEMCVGCLYFCAHKLSHDLGNVLPSVVSIPFSATHWNFYRKSSLLLSLPKVSLRSACLFLFSHLGNWATLRIVKMKSHVAFIISLWKLTWLFKFHGWDQIFISRSMVVI